MAERWEGGAGYEAYVGRWSRLAAGRFLNWLEASAGGDWVDVGSGTGALSKAVLDTCHPASVTGVEPSDSFRALAEASVPGARFLAGDAQSLPLPDNSCDQVVSGLVMNFVPDPRTALAEAARVLRPGGVVGAYVWDYAGGMEMIRLFWDAAVKLDPAAAALDEAARFPICTEVGLAELFKSAGLRRVEVTGIEFTAEFAGFDDYWTPFLSGGAAPAPVYCADLGQPGRDALRAELESSLRTEPDGRIRLRARAWAGKGLV